MSVNSKMTAIADPIRTLMGSTGKMNLDDMANELGIAVNEVDAQNSIIEQIKVSLTETEENIGRTNNEISTQAELIQQIKDELTTTEENLGRTNTEISTQSDIIQQIKTALEDKAAGGGVELPPLADDIRATSDDMAHGKQLYDDDGNVVEGNVRTITDGTGFMGQAVRYDEDGNAVGIPYTFDSSHLFKKDSEVTLWTYCNNFGNAKRSDVRQGVKFTSAEGLLVEGEALIPGGGFVYPDGAFAPVTNFTAGKQYAFVATIDGVRRYISSTSFNSYTMNATEVTISEDAGDYVIFSATPTLFTAVASGSGFLLQNGTNYLNGRDSGGTNLVLDATQMVWTVDTSATGGFSESVIKAKEEANAVWLINTNGNNRYTIKYESDSSGNRFGYDREGRDSQWSKDFVSFVLYEYVAGEGELNPVVDSSDANVTADKMLAGYSGYANGRKVEGNIQSRQAATITPSTTAQEIPAGVYLEGKQTISAIQTETKSVTENGTYTPSSGKYFSSFTVNVPSGGTSSAGLVVKSGTTTSATIATGLSSIEEFFIYKETQTATGLIRLHYSKTGGTSYMYASAWSTNNYGTKTITNATTAPTISGGSITLPSSTATSGGLSSGVTYKWTAIGTE